MERTRRRALETVLAGGFAGLAGCGSLVGDAIDGAIGDSLQDTTPSPPSLSSPAKLVATNGTPRSRFGSAVSLAANGTVALVGTEVANSAYVFEWTGESWQQRAELASPNGDENSAFGSSVSLAADGATALVGAYNERTAEAAATGAAFVFRRAGGDWRREATVTVPDDDESLDYFGSSVSLSADGATALVGASGVEDPDGSGTGSAFVFTRSGDDWGQQAGFSTSDAEYDAFGYSVSLAADGDTALVGAPALLGGDEPKPGNRAAYVFTRTEAGWRQQTTLQPDVRTGIGFGMPVSLAADGTTAIVGRQLEIRDEERVGTAYVYERRSGDWHQATKLTDRYGFGMAVSLSADGTSAIVGNPALPDAGDTEPDSVSVFRRSGASWREQSVLSAPDGDPEDLFGQSLSLEAGGTVALVGAPYDEDPNGEQAGSAYVFRVDENT